MVKKPLRLLWEEKVEFKIMFGPCQPSKAGARIARHCARSRGWRRQAISSQPVTPAYEKVGRASAHVLKPQFAASFANTFREVARNWHHGAPRCELSTLGFTHICESLILAALISWLCGIWLAGASSSCRSAMSIASTAPEFCQAP